MTGSSGLTGSSGNSSLTGSGLGSNTTSSYNTSSSEPLSEKIRETFGVGGSNKHGTGLGGRNDDPSYGTGSKRDKNSSLGSAVGHGSNPDTYAYNSKTAPGIGGHRIGGDDFTNSNTRNEGKDSLPTNLGSDVAAGRSGGQSSSGGLTGRSDNDGYSSSSGGLTGRSDNDRYSSGTTGESLTQKVKDYLPGTGTSTSTSTNTSSYSSTQPDSARAAAREVIAGSGRNDGYNNSSTYGSSNTSSLPVRSQDSTLTGDRGLTGSSSTGSGVTGTGSSGLTGTGSSGLTGTSSSGLTGTGSSGITSSSTPGYDSGLTSSHTHGHGISGAAFDQGTYQSCSLLPHSSLTQTLEREGYVPHGGHPIGEAAHNTEAGKSTWLDYRNDPTLPVARAEPADR